MTVRAEQVYNRMIVSEDVVQEIRLPGTTKIGTSLMFYKGQEIVPTELRAVNAIQVT